MNTLVKYNDAEITVTHNIALNASVEKVETDE